MDCPKLRSGGPPNVQGGPCAVLVALGAADGDAGGPVPLRSATSAHVSAAASEGRSMASRMTDASAMSTRPRRRALLARSVRPPGSRAPQLGSRTDRGQPLLRQSGGLSRGSTLARRPAGQSAQHPAHSFAVGRVRVSGVGVMVANRGAVQAWRRDPRGRPHSENRRQAAR